MDAVDERAVASPGMGIQHRCKVCGKGFSAGRSLGGHMRSHISLGEVVPEAYDEELRRVSPNGGRSSGGNGAVGYGLRENPKKTRRLSDFADEEEDQGGDGGEHAKACRDCGKLFPSWRSLFGHMRSHAPGAAADETEEDVDLEEDQFFAAEAEAEMEAEDVDEEMEAPMEPLVPAAVAVMTAPPRRRRRSMRVAAPAPAPPPPPVLGGFEKEQEDVALCLLMLSRDTTGGMWSSPENEEPYFEKEWRKKTAPKQLHLPRNGYGYNSDDDSALFQYGDAKIKKRRTSHYALNSDSAKQRRKVTAPPAPKRTRYECPGCGRVFSSYQALGGHRASHKRINTSCSAPKGAPVVAAIPAPEPSVDTYTSFSTLSPSASPDSVAVGIGAPKSSATAVAEKFECPVCFRVFGSGQALGGHKRSHMTADGACSEDGEVYYGGASGDAEQEQGYPVAAAGSLDLNFPPASSEEA
jgi:hypothetical protein